MNKTLLPDNYRLSHKKNVNYKPIYKYKLNSCPCITIYMVIIILTLEFIWCSCPLIRILIVFFSLSLSKKLEIRNYD